VSTIIEAPNGTVSNCTLKSDGTFPDAFCSVVFDRAPTFDVPAISSVLLLQRPFHHRE
jgi:hypothetical protein